MLFCTCCTVRAVLYVLHCTFLHRTVRYCLDPYCTVLYELNSTVLCCTCCSALYCTCCTALHCTVLSCTPSHCTCCKLYCALCTSAPYCVILSVICCNIQCRFPVQYVVLYCIELFCSVLCYTVLCSIAPYWNTLY